MKRLKQIRVPTLVLTWGGVIFTSVKSAWLYIKALSQTLIGQLMYYTLILWATFKNLFGSAEFQSLLLYLLGCLILDASVWMMIPNRYHWSAGILAGLQVIHLSIRAGDK